jgi:aryl-alcohol dehydrogenase-like predicted oxidoreductase
MVELLHAARHHGINFFDTSDMYAQGESEKVLGQALRGDRQNVVIATKMGYVLARQRRWVSVVKPVLRPIVRRLGLKRTQVPAAIRGAVSQDFSPGHIRSAVEGSLKRLRTDYIDLYQLHSPPVEVIEQGDFVNTLEALKQEGKIRHYGISCEDTDHAAASLKHPVVSLQLRINLLDPSALKTAIPMATELGVGVIARECLGGGAFSKPNEWLRGAVAEGVVTDEHAKRIEELAGEAAQNGHRLQDVALEWVLNNADISVVLLGMRDRKQLNENLSLATRAESPTTSSPR